MGIFSDYFRVAMRHAEYETLPEGEGVFATIPGLDGLWANAPTIEECRDELESVLDDWVLIGLRLGHEIPSIDGLSLAQSQVVPS